MTRARGFPSEPVRPSGDVPYQGGDSNGQEFVHQAFFYGVEETTARRRIRCWCRAFMRCPAKDVANCQAQVKTRNGPYRSDTGECQCQCQRGAYTLFLCGDGYTGGAMLRAFPVSRIISLLLVENVLLFIYQPMLTGSPPGEFNAHVREREASIL